MNSVSIIETLPSERNQFEKMQVSAGRMPGSLRLKFSNVFLRWRENKRRNEHGVGKSTGRKRSVLTAFVMELKYNEGKSYKIEIVREDL